MPELPEVQTIVGDLDKKIKGERIAGFWSDWKKGVKISYEKFQREITGKKILSVRRVGKNILLNLSGRKTVIVHLRMTGKLLIKSKVKSQKTKDRKSCYKQNDKHIHHIFYLKGGKRLGFSDVRKFGNLELVDSTKVSSSGSLQNVGVDALDKKFTFAKFGKILAGKKTNIKQLLMDQRKIAGIGNIYASEILHEAGILPFRKAGSLTGEERKKLFWAIGKVLKRAIRLRGTTLADYRDAAGRQGKFQRVLKVYRGTGKKCARCGTMVRRIKLGQRSTFYCPKCQK